MLYEQWLSVVQEKSDCLALWDGASARRWTFGELAREVDRLPRAEDPIRAVDGVRADFVMGVLQTWRDKCVLVPLEHGQSLPEISKLPPSDIVHLKTTSATTGAARMIGFKPEQLLADCDNVIRTMGLKPEIPNVGAISLAHSYGFSNLVLPLLLRGIPLLLAESALPESVRSTTEQAVAVALPSVPALWQAWFDAGIVSERVRIAISAGAPLSSSLEHQVFNTTGVKIHNFYGSSECGGIAYDRTQEPREDASVAGTPMDRVEVRLNQEGCITVEGNAVGATYWPIPEPALSGGIFQSGDLGEIIGGTIHLRGRACDRINVAGRKLSPEQVEEILIQHPTVKDCLVFGIPTESARNEKIVACVAAEPSTSVRELNDFLQSKLPGWQIPRAWWIVDSLDVNERGKRSRSEWRKRYLSEGR